MAATDELLTFAAEVSDSGDTDDDDEEDEEEVDTLFVL